MMMITIYENTPENLEIAKAVPVGVVAIDAATGMITVCTGEDIPPVPVPQVVSRMQAMIVLESAGLLAGIETYMATAPKIEQLAWANAQEFSRTSPMVLKLAGMLELDDAALDALFVAAGGVAV